MADRHVAMVTGGGGGIGSALCETLGRAGAFVLVAGRDQDRCGSVAEIIRDARGAAEPVSLDVTQPASIAAAIEEAHELAGPIDWLVNNAGFVNTAPIRKTDEEHYRSHMDVNFHGARRMVEAVLPDMLATGYGRVVQIASAASLRGYAYVTAYVAAKHALLGYSRAAALELLGKNVAINAVCPHYVDSPMTDANVARMVAATGRSDDEIRTLMRSENPGGMMITPEEVAVVTVDLLETDYTGRVIELLGGGVREVESGIRLEPAEAGR